MRAGIRRGLGAVLMVAATAGAAEAQVFTPTYTSPRLINELGLHLSDSPTTIEGIWRAGALGIRVGYMDAIDGFLSIGGELRSAVPIQDAPIGLALVIAGQGLFGDNGGAGVGAGLSAGYTFMSPGVAFTPYLHPRVAFVSPIGPATDWDVEVLADLGLDIEFANNVLIRLGITLGDIGTDWGVGLAWRR
jgi:hypothetical protein